MRVLFVFLIAFGLVACGDSDPVVPTPAPIEVDPHAGHNHAPGEGHDHEHDHDHVDIEMSYDDLLGLAKLSMDSSDCETAILRYLDAIETDSSRVEGYYGIGYCFSELGNFKKAAEYLESAMFINPDYRNTRLNLGSCQIMLKEYKEGIAILSLAIEKDANCVPCYLNRANGYRQLEQTKKMCADLKKAESLGSKDATALLQTDCK